ncbi:MAG: four-carbon acid sugar kinase family protein [Bryobacteraceae bacterium]
MRVNIVADDITGACDTGVAFPGAVVALTPEAPEAAVTVFSTDSRNDAADLAAAKIRALRARLPEADLVYKKIDSIMRGNVREEVAAFDREDVVVCPAFPEQGRTVENGRALPAGIDLRAMFGASAIDARTTNDLRRIAEEALARKPLLVGSAGLAREIARLLGAGPVTAAAAPGAGCPILCVGSTHDATVAQVDHLLAHSRLGYEFWRIDSRNPSAGQLRLLADCVRPRQTGGLFLSGGDTALLVLEALGAKAIRLEAELSPGVPVGRIVGGAGDGLAVITKSGGFGGPETLTRAVELLSGMTRVGGNV